MDSSSKSTRKANLFTGYSDVFSKILLAVVFCGGLAACEKEGPAEKAGKEVDQATTNVGNKVEDACENAKEAAGAKDTRC